MSSSAVSSANRVKVDHGDTGALERLARCILRLPGSLERMSWGEAGDVHYRREPGHDRRLRHDLILACELPAWQAARVSPMELTRKE